MQCLTVPHADDLEREIADLDREYDDLQSQPRQLERATREHRASFEAATRDHRCQGALLTKIDAGDAGGALGVAREILADVRQRLAAGEFSTTTIQIGAAASK